MSDSVVHVGEITSNYYDEVVRVDGIALRGENMSIRRELVEDLIRACVVLAGIRGYYRPTDNPGFCQSCDEAMRFIGHLTDKFRREELEIAS